MPWGWIGKEDPSAITAISLETPPVIEKDSFSLWQIRSNRSDIGLYLCAQRVAPGAPARQEWTPLFYLCVKPAPPSKILASLHKEITTPLPQEIWDTLHTLLILHALLWA